MNDLPSKLSPALNLLRDPKDESKFVGLLLVSKVLGSAIPPLPVAPPPSTSPENAAKSTIDSSEFSRKLRVGPNLGDSEDEEDGDSPNREDFDSDVKVTEESEDDDDEDESKSEDAASVPQAPPFDTQILKSIFDAVGFKFLARLIKTTKGDNADISQRLGLSIASTLCMHSELACKFAPLSADVLAIMHSAGEQEMHVLDDGARCLLASGALLSATEQSIQSLLENVEFSSLASNSFMSPPSWSSLSSNMSTVFASSLPAHQVQLALDLASHRFNSATPEVKTLLLQMVDSVLNGAEPDLRAQMVTCICPSLLKMLTSAFATLQTAQKFDLLKTLMQYIQSLHSSSSGIPKNVFQDENWPYLLRSGLRDILFSRSSLSSASSFSKSTSSSFTLSRRRALSLCSTMLKCFGSDWPIRPWGDEEEQNKFFTTGVFVQVLMKLITVEVRVLLESNAINSAEGDDEDGFNHQADSLCTCFHMVEMAIQFLTEDDGNIQTDQPEKGASSWSSLPAPVLLSIQQGLKELFTAVFIFLSDARDDEKPVSTVILACIRALGAWLAEESGALRQEFTDILPYLLSITDHAEPETDALSYLLPGLAEAVLDADVCAAAAEHHVPQRALAIALSYRRYFSPNSLFTMATDALNCAELSASCEVARNMLLFNPDLLTTKSSLYLNAVVPLFDLTKSLESASNISPSSSSSSILSASSTSSSFASTLLEPRGHLVSLLLTILKNTSPSELPDNAARLVESDLFWSTIIAFLASSSILDLHSLYGLCLQGIAENFPLFADSISRAIASSTPPLIPGLIKDVCSLSDASIDDDSFNPAQAVESFLLSITQAQQSSPTKSSAPASVLSQIQHHITQNVQHLGLLVQFMPKLMSKVSSSK